MELNNLKNKTVLLTGGAGWLAEHFTKSLVDAGAKVVLVDVDKDAVAQRAAMFGDSAVGMQMDVTKDEEVASVFATAIDAFGSIDVVVNNAAIDPKFDPNVQANTSSFEQYPDEMMRQSIEVNMLGAWRVSKAAVKHMLSAGGGNIVTISSIYGVTVPHQDIYAEGTQKPVDYGMTKSAIQYMTRYIAATYGKQGIRANALVLGGVFKGHDDKFVEKYSQHTMLGRMTQVDEVGAPLVFLASDASKGMTGHLLAVDAGWSAW